MLNRSALYFILLTSAISSAITQTQALEQGKSSINQKSEYNFHNIPAQLEAAKQKLYKTGTDKKDLDALIDIFKEGWQLKNNINDKEWQNVVIALNTEFDIEQGNIDAGVENYKTITDYYHNLGDVDKEAFAWRELGIRMPLNVDHWAVKQQEFYARSLDLYKKTGNKIGIASAQESIAISHFNQGKVDLAEAEMLTVLKLYTVAGYKELNISDNFLSEIYRRKGNNYRRLYYELEALKNAPKKVDSSNVAYVVSSDLAIGQIYYDLGNYSTSMEWYKKTPFFDQTHPDLTDYYYLLPNVVAPMRALGQARQAIEFIKQCTINSPPKNTLSHERVSQAYGDCYLTLKNYPEAEKNYLEMLRLHRSTYQEDKYFFSYYRVLANFYIVSGQLNKARFYVTKLNQFPDKVFRADQLQQVELFRFKIDSAFGNIYSAVKHYQNYTRLKDSLYNVVKSQQTSELQIKYETTSKEQSIKLLKTQAQGQRAELQKVNLQRNITIAGVAMLLIVAGLAYNGYRNKQRSNVALELKQAEINQQNAALQHLLGDKDKLLSEKDWLLKEVHHRVKNNLQIVMSLLSTQSAYLENTAALDAISDSRNRVQAISLIHQKLYATNHVASIDMPAYISDLVGYLKDCLNTSAKRIRFDLLVEEVRIDISQAVPLGLIMNESITNAIKYAFGEKGGVIIVGLQLLADETLLLKVSDNGKGLPADFNIREAASLGMEMMKALTKQLGGSFQVKSNKGVTLTVEFRVEKMHYSKEIEEFYS